MRPPVVAEALLAAAAAPTDYESIAGDLHEEYVRYVRSCSTRTANQWYWSQVLLSIPSLLSYSSARRSALHAIGIGFIATAVLVAMLLASIPINALLKAIFGGVDNCPLTVYICAFWTDAAVFGTVLALLVRNGGVPVAFWTASVLVLAYAIPALMGFPSSQAPIVAWVSLGGIIPSMCAGAGFYQIATRRGTS